MPIVNQEAGKAFLDNAARNISEQVGISTEEAKELLKRLAQGEYIVLSLSAESNTPATVLFVNQRAGNVTSVKGGNFIVNLKKDWKNLQMVFAGAKALQAKNPLTFLIAVASLVSLPLSKRGAAIIMALHPEGRVNIADERKEADFWAKVNALLRDDGVDKFSLQNELQQLEDCGIVEQNDGIVSMKERIVAAFWTCCPRHKDWT